jgi:hypothetical protein
LLPPNDPGELPHPPNDPTRPPQPRTDLPDLRTSKIPVGYRPGAQIGERLQGLGLVVIGLAGLILVYVIYQSGGLPGAPEPPPAPPGLQGLRVLPLISVTNCMVPLLTIGSMGLILLGMRRIADP